MGGFVVWRLVCWGLSGVGDIDKDDVVGSLSAEQLREASERTLGHYNRRAEAFWEGTRGHDVSQNIEALLRHLPAAGSHSILDFGCGPGRDLMTFRRLGHAPVGLDGAEQFVALARAHAGCEVWQQDFLALELPGEHFMGVFANATLFHVPGQELPRVLAQLWACLVPGGALFSSNPRGDNREGWSGERYGCYLDLPSYRALMVEAGFVELEHYYRPTGKPRHEQPWLASVWRKPAV